MLILQLKIKKLRDSAVVPQRATAGSVGYDLCACLENVVGNKITIKPGETVKIKTGIAIEIAGELKSTTEICQEDNNIGGFVFARSGLATNHGIALANCVGVIDSDYRGEIIVPLKNSSDVSYEICDKDRIAQIVFLPAVIFEDVVTTDELSDSQRAHGGFGSTGKN